MVDGNSVTYAENADGYHTKADSVPVSKYDPVVRNKVGSKWKSPVTGLKNRNAPNYFDIDDSENKANKNLEG